GAAARLGQMLEPGFRTELGFGLQVDERQDPPLVVDHPALDVRATEVDPEVERRRSGHGTHQSSPGEMTQEFRRTPRNQTTLRTGKAAVNRPLRCAGVSACPQGVGRSCGVKGRTRTSWKYTWVFCPTS